MSKAEQLINDLHKAFEYTRDNNRDLICDESFSMTGTVEEIQLEFCWQFICAYISRNKEMIEGQLND